MSLMPDTTTEESTYAAEFRALVERMPPTLMLYLHSSGMSCGSPGDLTLMKRVPGGAAGIDSPIPVRCA